jgi:hypothetical protein
MDLALTINGWIDEEIIFAQQLGARHVFAQVDNSSGWDAQALARLANRIEKAGLVLAGLHASAAVDAGQPAETLTWAARLAQEAGAARIILLSLSPALFPARRSAANPTSALLVPLADAAAQAGVTLAIPVAALLKEFPGAANPEKVLHSLPPSAGLDGSPGLLLDWLQKSGPEANLRQLTQDRLCLVSFENERRPARKQNSAGFDDLLSLCWRLRQAGYPGLIRLGQPSRWKGDTRAGHHARAFTTGYLRAVLQAFQRVDTPR